MPVAWREGDIEDREGKNYYRSIHSFTNRVRIAALTRDAKQIQYSAATPSAVYTDIVTSYFLPVLAQSLNFRGKPLLFRG